MATKSNSRDIIARAGALGAAWAIRELMKTPTGERLAKKVNNSFETVSGEAAFKAKTAKRNAGRNRGLLSAGIAVVAIGLAIIGRASLK